MEMASEHTKRRLARMQNYPAFKNATDDYIITILEDALAVFLDFTHRGVDPGEEVDSLVCEIARTQHARMGVEGVTRATDGEIMRVWSEMGGLDASLIKRMKAYRLVVGINATSTI